MKDFYMSIHKINEKLDRVWENAYYKNNDPVASALVAELSKDILKLEGYVEELFNSIMEEKEKEEYYEDGSFEEPEYVDLDDDDEEVL